MSENMYGYYEANIGKNIKEVRTEQGLAQQTVATRCGFSNTVLSAYENGKKIPNLTTIATIAKVLNVNIERLYYGDDNNAFIESAQDEGRKIVNSLYLLWSTHVVSNYVEVGCGKHGENPVDLAGGAYLALGKHKMPIKRLLAALNDFKSRKETYSEPDKFLEILLASVATEINLEAENSKDIPIWSNH